MRILFKDAKVINVFTSCVEKKDVLIEDEKIINVGVFKYDLSKIDKVIDCKDKYLAPGFIDGHIHIESSMLLPTELSKLLIKRGTTSAVCDPHEVANVKGLKGIDFMLENAKNALMDLYFMIPSCVPATIFDQNFGPISAKDIKKYYDNPMVLGLAEMMNFVGVINDDEEVLEKINDCLNKNLVVDGHSPLLTGEDLDKYLASGISSDHECTNLNEAIEKLSEGMWIMIREGSAAKNLTDLIDLFDEKYNSRCLLVTDDIEALHLEKNGDIDYIINKATKLGKNPIVGIKMATIQAATRFKLQNVGAICPGYDADIILFDDLKIGRAHV